MSNAAINAHLQYGQPCGDSADLSEIADWAGAKLLNLASEVQSLKEKLFFAELDYNEACLDATAGVQETREETVKKCLDIIRSSLHHVQASRETSTPPDHCFCKGCTRAQFLIEDIVQEFSLDL